MTLPRPNIFRVAREVGVRLVASKKHSPSSRRPFQCFCKPTIREIGQRWGEEHLRLTLMLVTGTRHNANHLFADVLKAVARLLANNPELIKRPSLVDDFNALDFGQLRRQARGLRSGVATVDVLVILLTLRFMPSEKIFALEKSNDLPRLDGEGRRAPNPWNGRYHQKTSRGEGA